MRSKFSKRAVRTGTSKYSVKIVEQMVVQQINPNQNKTEKRTKWIKQHSQKQNNQVQKCSQVINSKILSALNAQVTIGLAVGVPVGALVISSFDRFGEENCQERPKNWAINK
ncbi:Hypothetical_protein [Hexamita inflata]|uniref:Hypothetical_protein n=1 Tax=Hexamita inflata TaxID=28002 RepID=A0AA86RJV1_9EUKA|nr:Hypothetical protein HINF_LOCUS65622 [Hexamita inflata]